VLINGGLLVWGAEERAVPVLTGAFRVGALAVPRVRVLTFGIAAAATLALYVFLRLSDWGRAVRATAQAPIMAQTCGIDVRRVRGLTFALATALAALAGSLLVIMIPVDPQVGGLLILKAFAVVVLGGLGNLLGALLGGLILANAEVFAAYYISPVLSEAVAFLVLLALLLLRRHDPLAVGTA
jgi:branched-chain amino acid transport system permease protein